MRAYFAAIEFMDAQVGKLLNTLERLKLANDTVIVFWGDNGYQLGEHGQWMKQTNFEAAARIPMIMSAPGNRGKGRGCSRTVELLDIYPTLAEVCGLEHKPANLQGRSVAPLLENPTARWDAPAVSQMERREPQRRVMGYSLRNERYRYTEWDDGTQGVELYDHETDVNEWTNLAGKSKAAAIQKEMHDLLRAQKSNLPPRS